MQGSDAGDLATCQDGGKVVTRRYWTGFRYDQLALRPIVESRLGVELMLLDSLVRGLVRALACRKSLI